MTFEMAASETSSDARRGSSRRLLGDPPYIYEAHVFCCINERPDGHLRGCCAGKGARQLCDYMCRRAMALGLTQGTCRIRINHAGCLSLCEFGPVMIVYPEGVAYSYRSNEDIEEILRKHLILGRRVEHLVLRIDPGKLH